jgi:ribonuclease-3 family protein
MDYLKTKMTDDNIRGISMLGLAHLGDAVFELMVRSWLCVSGRATAKGLHRASVSWVSAGAQARAAGKLLPALSPEEADMYRRGRNARVRAIPRGATVGEYHAATGFETLFGYLYLKGRTERLNELFELLVADEDGGEPPCR